MAIFLRTYQRASGCLALQRVPAQRLLVVSLIRLVVRRVQRDLVPLAAVQVNQRRVGVQAHLRAQQAQHLVLVLQMHRAAQAVLTSWTPRRLRLAFVCRARTILRQHCVDKRNLRIMCFRSAFNNTAWNI